MDEEQSEAAVLDGFSSFDPSLHSHEVAEDDQLLLFPEFMYGDKAVYRPTVIQLAKQLSNEGLNVRYAFPPERRTSLHLNSAGEVAQQLAIGAASGVPLFLLGQFLARRREGEVTVKVTRARKVRGRRMWDAEIVELSGTVEDVSQALQSLPMHDAPDE